MIKKLLCQGMTQMNFRLKYSYLVRLRNDDKDQFTLIFFDGCNVHKMKMNVGVYFKGENPIVVIALLQYYFKSWRDLVDHFSVNAIVTVNPGCVDKLTKAFNKKVIQK